MYFFIWVGHIQEKKGKLCCSSLLQTEFKFPHMTEFSPMIGTCVVSVPNMRHACALRWVQFCAVKHVFVLSFQSGQKLGAKWNMYGHGFAIYLKCLCNFRPFSVYSLFLYSSTTHPSQSLALVPKLATRLCNLHCHIALNCPIGIIS